MKKIVIVAHHYPPHITGVGLVAHNQAKRLAADGYEVTVITSNTQPDEDSCVMDGIHVIRIKAYNGLETRWNAPFPLFSPRLFFILKKYIKYSDIVHIHDAFYMSSFFAALTARFYKKPVILTQHVAMVPHPSKFLVAIQKMVYATSGRLIFKWSNTIITINDRVERFLLDRGVPKGKLVILPNGVDTDLFSIVDKERKIIIREQFGLSLNKKIVLFVGRFVPKKGFDKVLAAKSNDYQIVFAGGDAPTSHNKNEDAVVFLGKLSQQELAKVYQAADLFVLPSHGEGFPLSIQEAMASGLPVITTNDEGYRRYKFDESLVCLIKDPTEDSVRQAIASLIHDDERLQRMATYSHGYARTNFSWPLIVGKLKKTYHDVSEK